MKPTRRYLIVENGDLLDGCWYSDDDLGTGIAVADYDAKIFAFDLSELTADGATSLRDVTEDAVSAWWFREGLATTMDRIEQGYPAPDLAARFFAGDVNAHTSVVEAASRHDSFSSDKWEAR